MTDVEAPPLPDSYVCPDGTVPGWLNIDGLPTSCVGDLPLVEPLPEREVNPTPIPAMPPAPFEDGELGTPQDVTPHTHVEVPSQRELAETGPVDPLTVLLFGSIVLSAGVATWLTRMSKKEDS